MPSFAGLQTNLFTWLIILGLTACWMFSVRLVPGWANDRWRSVLKSLFGFVWLGFGVDILLRFLMLSYNAVEWGDDTSRLVVQSADTVNVTLAYCWLFWLLLALAYRFAVERKGAGPLGVTRIFTLDVAYAAALPMALTSSALFYLTDGPTSVIPLALLTPLSAFALLYVVPATLVWWDHFRHPDPWWRVGTIQLITLLPAAVNAWRSPYRENVAPLFLIPLLAALFAGRRPRLRTLVPAGLVCFLAVTSLITGYRRVKWENARTEEVTSEMRSAGVVDWLTGSWGNQMKRFHSFDSILLTVHLVPGARPYSGRNVLVTPFLRGFVPRFIYGDKGVSDVGERFGAEIWAYEDPNARDHGGASIAPSMPGDLYDSGGVLDIALGALIWGALMGLLDGWKGHLPAYSAAAITALVSTGCAMSIERDFDHSVAGLLQIFILLIVVSALIALARRRDSDFAVNPYPNFHPNPNPTLGGS
jgi:hypothetical protein